MSEGASSLYIPLASGVTDCAVLDQFLVTLLRKMRPEGRCSNKSSPNGAKSDGERFPPSETQVESGVAHALKRFSVFDDDGDNWVNPVDGEARYPFDVKQSTTTNLTPQEIHEIGLAQWQEAA